ncbi:MAG: hypothetical protein HLX51_01740 [Micrococcaceae bacterium]|nr:hypothetical protein [Micrococcaceae bacterium]
MAIPTKYDIEFSCGHKETKDLSKTAPGKRKARSFGLGKNFVCSRCFKKQGHDALEKQNQQQLVDAGAFESEYQLPAIQGTQKQINWATRVRYEVLAEIVDSDESESDQRTAVHVIDVAKAIPKAGWWLDNCTDKSLTVDDLIELITTAVEDDAGRDEVQLENPF